MKKPKQKLAKPIIKWAIVRHGKITLNIRHTKDVCMRCCLPGERVARVEIKEIAK